MQAAAIANSPLLVGAFDPAGTGRVARMVTDLATFAWLCDVYVLDGTAAADSARRWCA